MKAVSPPKRPAPRDRRDEESPAGEDAREQENASHDHRENGVAPRVAAHERGGHADHAKPDRGLAGAAALGAPAPPSLMFDLGVLRREGVDQKSEPEESDETAENEGNELESHPRAEAGDAT